MKKYIFFAILILFISSCTTNKKTKKSNNNSNTLSYLALGDSYTIGQNVSEQERWPNQLKQRLINNKIPINELNIIAQTGWTTYDLIKAIERENSLKHDLVTLQIGVNNQYQKLPFKKFKGEFEGLLTIAINKCKDKARVFVISIPDYGVTPFGKYNSQQIKKDLDQYNQFIKQTCKLKGIKYIDITKISRTIGDSGLTSDELHPNKKQYEKWVGKILPEVVQSFK